MQKLDMRLMNVVNLWTILHLFVLQNQHLIYFGEIQELVRSDYGEISCQTDILNILDLVACVNKNTEVVFLI